MTEEIKEIENTIDIQTQDRLGLDLQNQIYTELVIIYNKLRK